MKEDLRPVEPRRVEKLILKSGSSVLLYSPRVSHFMDGTGISGTLIRDGAITQATMRVYMYEIDRRVAMGWSHTLVDYVEMPDEPLPSDF